MKTFTVKAHAYTAKGKKVVWISRIKATDVYAANDKVKALLAVRGGVYYPVILFGKQSHQPSHELVTALEGAGFDE